MTTVKSVQRSCLYFCQLQVSEMQTLRSVYYDWLSLPLNVFACRLICSYWCYFKCKHWDLFTTIDSLSLSLPLSLPLSLSLSLGVFACRLFSSYWCYFNKRQGTAFLSYMSIKSGRLAGENDACYKQWPPQCHTRPRWDPLFQAVAAPLP